MRPLPCFYTILHDFTRKGTSFYHNRNFWNNSENFYRARIPRLFARFSTHFLTFLHVFRPTFGFYDKNFCHNRNFLQFYIKFLLRRKLRIAWHVLSRHTPPLIFVGNGVEYVCASNCTSDIKSENGFEHPNVTTSNVPTMVGMLLLYNKVYPEGTEFYV